MGRVYRDAPLEINDERELDGGASAGEASLGGEICCAGNVADAIEIDRGCRFCDEKEVHPTFELIGAGILVVILQATECSMCFRLPKEILSRK